MLVELSFVRIKTPILENFKNDLLNDIRTNNPNFDFTDEEYNKEYERVVEQMKDCGLYQSKFEQSLINHCSRCSGEGMILRRIANNISTISIRCSNCQKNTMPLPHSTPVEIVIKQWNNENPKDNNIEELKKEIESKIEHLNAVLSVRTDFPYHIQYCLRMSRNYNPAFNGKMCKCGHLYERHFDPYEDNYAAGCKYCGCMNFEERTSKLTKEKAKELLDQMPGESVLYNGTDTSEFIRIVNGCETLDELIKAVWTREKTFIVTTLNNLDGDEWDDTIKNVMTYKTVMKQKIKEVLSILKDEGILS